VDHIDTCIVGAGVVGLAIGRRLAMTAYLADIEHQGGSFVGGTQLTSVEIQKNRFVLRCSVQGEPYEFSCKVLVNSAGRGAQKLASDIKGLDAKTIPELHYCKGNYFTLASGSPFNHLIYPLPDKFAAGSVSMRRLIWVAR